MNSQATDPVRKEAKLPIRQLDPATASAELQLRLEEVKTIVARLEEAKVVSQETMQREVSI